MFGGISQVVSAGILIGIHETIPYGILGVTSRGIPRQKKILK